MLKFKFIKDNNEGDLFPEPIFEIKYNNKMEKENCKLNAIYFEKNIIKDDITKLYYPETKYTDYFK